MQRRSLLRSLFASAFGWAWPALALPTHRSATVSGTSESLGEGSPSPRPLRARVIGVGSAGNRLALQTWQNRLLPDENGPVSFALVTGDDLMPSLVKRQCDRDPYLGPIQVVSVGNAPACSRKTYARLVSRMHSAALRALVEDVDIVCLVAGVGGVTGSTVAPLLAEMARAAGVRVVVVVASPFGWALGRYPGALAAVRALERHSDCLASLANDMASQVFGEAPTLDGVMALQAQEITAVVRRLLVLALASRYEAGHRLSA